MDGSRCDVFHRRLVSGRRGMVGGVLTILGAVVAPSFAAGKGNNAGKGRRKRKKVGASACCPPGQVPYRGSCCSADHICNDNQGNQVCCPHHCFFGLCCPCDNVLPCQQCLVSGSPPQAGCQQYCDAGQFCMPGGCVTFP